ncbi:aminotransferase class V-fold PLP-dependent enzyme [Escherichia coli]
MQDDFFRRQSAGRFRCSREVNGLPLAYLDSAASAQKPSQVIDAEAEFYRHGYAAVHRGIHTLSAQATEKMENVRKRASLFINARSAEELVFVRGTTEGIDLVANSWGNSNVRAGDNIIISQMEHHANIVPGRCFVHASAQSCGDPSQSRRYAATGDAT